MIRARTAEGLRPSGDTLLQGAAEPPALPQDGMDARPGAALPQLWHQSRQSTEDWSGLWGQRGPGRTPRGAGPTRPSLAVLNRLSSSSLRLLICPVDSLTIGNQLRSVLGREEKREQGPLAVLWAGHCPVRQAGWFTNPHNTPMRSRGLGIETSASCARPALTPGCTSSSFYSSF